MRDFSRQSVHQIASDPQIKAAVHRFQRLHDAEIAVSQAGIELAVAEQDLLKIQREVEKSKMDL